METKRSFAVQLQILTKRLVLRFMRRPLAELPNIFISAFFLFVYDGALGGVFGGSAQGTPFDFANGNFVNFILPVSIVSASRRYILDLFHSADYLRFSFSLLDPTNE